MLIFMFRPALARVFCLTFCLTTLISLSRSARALDGTFLAAAGNRDMVYDSGRGVLYITGTVSGPGGTTGALLRYSIRDGGTQLSPVVLGGDLYGVDLSPDGNTLAVADASNDGINGWIFLLDINSGTVSKVMYPLAGGPWSGFEQGAYDVAFGSDGAILVSAAAPGGRLDYYLPLRRYDPAANVWSTVRDYVEAGSSVSASADRGVIAFVSYQGGAGRYRVSDGDVIFRDETVLQSHDNFAIAPNPGGTQFLLLGYDGGSVLGADMLPTGKKVGSPSNPPPGAAYNPMGSTAFVAQPGSTAVRTDEVGSWNAIAEFYLPGYFDGSPSGAFHKGWMRVASDGSLVFVNVVGGVQYFQPELRFWSYNQAVSTVEDNSTPITLTGGFYPYSTYAYQVTTQPAHGVLSGSPPNLTYTPAANFFGSDSFTFVTQAGSYTSTPGTITITVNSSNDAPTFIAGANQTVAEDSGPRSVTGWATAISPGPANESGQTVNFIVSASDTSKFSAQPAVSPAGTLTFTPAANANGTVTVTVKLRDSGGTANGGVDTSAAQTFTITITPVQDPPIAIADSATTRKNTAVVIAVLANDSDPDGDTLRVTAASKPITGTVVINANGTITYTPKKGFTGNDSFTYTISDGKGGTASATVQVKVTS